MDIKFSEDQMRAIVTKAILEGLGEQQRDLLIQKALETLMGPAANPNDYHNRDKRSKVEKAFDDATYGALVQVARDELAKPEWQEKILALVADAAQKAFAEERRPRLVEGMSHALAEALQKAGRD